MFRWKWCWLCIGLKVGLLIILCIWLRLVWSFGVSFSVRLVNCMWFFICISSGLLNSLWRCLRVWLIVGCDMVRCCVVWDMWCLLRSVLSIISRLRLIWCRL